MSKTLVEVFEGLLKDARDLEAVAAKFSGSFSGENKGWRFSVAVFNKDSEENEKNDGDSEVRVNMKDDDEDEIFDDEDVDIDDGGRCNCHCEGCGEECVGTDIEHTPLKLTWVDTVEDPTKTLLTMRNDGRFEIAKAACSSTEAKIVIEELCSFINSIRNSRKDKDAK